MAGKRTLRTQDSTKTRVAPVFDALLAQDATGEKWLAELLALPRGGHPIDPAVARKPGQIETLRFDSRNGKTREKRLAPPTSLLKWLVEHFAQVRSEPIEGDGKKAQRRNQLLAGHRETIDKALAKLASGPKSRAWYVLEGKSAPDVLLETPEAVIVIEGKRTEAGPTVGTKWMPARHQMLRHMDAAWEIANGRRVLGFFIVEGGASGEVPPAWLEAARNTLAPGSVAASLPHRTAAERDAITRGFLGVTTWQQVRDRLGVEPKLLQSGSA
jgi:hypothetical protein